MEELMVQQEVREVAETQGFHAAWDFALDKYLDLVTRTPIVIDGVATDVVEHDEYLAGVIHKSLRQGLAHSLGS